MMYYKYLRSYFICLGAILCISAKGQNTLSLNTTSTVFNAISTANDLATEQIRSNALVITARPKSNACIITVRATASSIPVNKLWIMLNAVTKGAANVISVNTNKFALSATPVTLLSVQKRNADISASYNLYLAPLGWDIAGGYSYRFDLQFTITPQ